MHFFRTNSILRLLLSALLIIACNYPAVAQWHQELNDSCKGINLPAALDYLKSHGMKPRRVITVGVIDSGLDSTAVDLKGALWVNPKEKPDGKDNDHNGYADDIHGWNFLGTSDGSFNMISAGTEEYREFKRLFPKYKDIDSTAVTDRDEYAYYKVMRKKAGIDSYLNFYGYAALKQDAFNYIDSTLRVMYQPAVLDTITVGTLIATVETDDQKLLDSFQGISIDLLKAGNDAPWRKVKSEQDASFELMGKRIHGIEHDADKRLLMGDNLKDAADRFYGNPCLHADGCDHGTVVAAIIAGQGKADSGVTGIWPDARVMIIRAVPEGDEYDKDVATSIRYAVDNGAKVINMSLGKMTSPDSTMVNEAIAYALKHDVLILQASGNSTLDIDKLGYYPSAIDPEGKTYPNYMRVGASDPQGLISSLSNYGVAKVDLLAPGVHIKANDKGTHFMEASGTSVATPVVSGLAALLRAYFPKLKACQIKEILVQSCRVDEKLAGTCRSCGIVDALRAVELAATYK